MRKIQKRIETQDRFHVERINYVHVYITKQCNLYCPHCFTESSPSKKEVMPVEFWMDVFKQLSDLAIKTLHIEGGEPLLYPRIEDLVRFVVGSRIKELLLVSNGILADRERLAALKDAGLNKIAISLDSLDENVHNELRGNSIRYALGAIDATVALGFYTRVSTVVHKRNIQGLGELLDYLCGKGVSTINLDWFNGAGRGRELLGRYQISSRDEELLEMFEEAVSAFLRRRGNGKTSLSIDLPQWYENRDSFLVNDPQLTHFLECDAICKQLSIDEMGNVYPCFIYSGGPHSIGNLKDSRLEDLVYDRFRHLPVVCPIGYRKHIFYQTGNGNG